MGWRESLRYFLDMVPKRSLVDGYINVIEMMVDDEEERRRIARKMVVNIMAHRYIEGEIKSLEGLNEDFRKEVEAEVGKLKARYIA